MNLKILTIVMMKEEMNYYIVHLWQFMNFMMNLIIYQN